MKKTPELFGRKEVFKTMTRIPVSGQNPYDIEIAAGALSSCGERIGRVKAPCRALVISDSHVAPLYGEAVLSSLKAAGFFPRLHTFPAGEANKTLATVEGMLAACAAAGLCRSDLIVALGGGVTGDMAGFAAAIYLRGIDFVQLPTTLLSMIDSSVGGKTGCDLPFGKNLAGAFHNPRLVLIDPSLLSTLPDRYMRDGMGETVKYGCIFSEALISRLEREDYRAFLPELIRQCVEMKRDVVEADFTEQGCRTLLNFGHTIGHAIEKEENFSGLSHGEAVAAGMAILTRAAERLSLCEEGTALRLEGLLNSFGLPTGTSISPERLAAAALHDKKMRGDTIRLVLLRKMGEGYVETVEAARLAEIFALGM